MADCILGPLFAIRYSLFAKIREASVAETIAVELRGKRGYLVGIDPQVCVALLGATPVQCALAE